MRQIVLAIALAVSASTATAQDETAEGLSLIERGAQLLLEGFMKDMDPVIEDFRAMAEEFGPKMAEMMEQMGPAFAELANRIDDIRNYEAPEILPNGDIIIRRRPDAPVFDGQGGEIEL
ncbi:MAG: hypothetical protein CSA72_04415 [Rhodobacterales bacterium]|nr:MAG: hypothetical protein CSA72_04415 [Rhodobacterales bacterium]